MGTDVYSTFRHAYDQIGARGGANTTANAVGGIREVRNQLPQSQLQWIFYCQ